MNRKPSYFKTSYQRYISDFLLWQVYKVINYKCNLVYAFFKCTHQLTDDCVTKYTKEKNKKYKDEGIKSNS